MIDEIISSFVAKQKELLALELQADEDPDEDDRAANSLGNLEISDVSVGLYGRTVVQLTLWSSDTSSKLDALLPAHRLTAGDEVEIRSKQRSRKGFPGGVVCEVADTHVAVALFSRSNAATKQGPSEVDGDEHDTFGTPPLMLLPRSSAEVNKKLIHALNILEKHGSNHPVAGPLVQAMFHAQDFPPFHASSFQPFNEGLDDSQKEAISFALQADQPIALIHGPPGTGKTTTVTELIQQAVHVHKLKVLVTAPSNVAVDNVLERIVISNNSQHKSRKGTFKIRAVRLGHPARLKSSILPYSLEALVQGADGTEIVADVRDELQSYLRILSNPKSRGADKRMAYSEVKSLRKEIRTREEKVVQELISTAQVVLATTVGAANRILDHVDAFDLVIIDEAAQALEASCWIPILRGKRVVLAGDHCQLPPTIKSKQAEKALGKTMFERLVELYNEDNKHRDAKISRMLSVQYRMHEKIATWASEAMYHGNLRTHESVGKRTLSQLDGFHKEEGEEDDIIDIPLLMIDTAGCDMHELITEAGSRYNPGEASLVIMHVQRLIGAGLKPEQMCVITPYNGQVEWLRNLLLRDYPSLEIRSVDGFQGGEREAVILSLVRSSWRSGAEGIGFLKDNRRQNVAVTRAKRHLAVICDSETVSQSKFIASLLSWIEQNGELRSALEYQGSTHADERDLRAVEAELMNIIEPQIPHEKATRRQPKKGPTTEQMGPEARQGLMDRIAAFAGAAAPGEELTLTITSSFSSFDQRLVKEFAEQVGLGHRSEGTEGHDRRIILKKGARIRDPVMTAAAVLETEGVLVSSVDGRLPTTGDQSDHDENCVSSPKGFSVLSPDDDSDDEEESKEQGVTSGESQRQVVPPHDAPSSNAWLAALGNERAERQKERNHRLTPVKTKNLKKTNAPQAQLLGGTSKSDPKKDDDVFNDLDDIAFLEVQIQKSQNAHGRKVVGSGTGHRTIINGILNSRPERKPTPTNARAAATLQSKLKQARESRKVKSTKKK